MATPTAVLGSSTVDTLASERLKSEGYLQTNELATWCAGSQKSLDSKLRIAEALKHDVEFQKLGEMEDIYLLPKKERYILSSKKYVFAWNKIKSGALARSPYFITSSSDIRRFMMLMLGPDAHTMAIHDLMFLPTLRNQTSPEQKKAWLPAAEARAILGCYAQTEIGHGSDVRSLETIAVYDNTTATFDLHSPTQTSTKWWPAALGRTATHAIVHARLILSTGVDCGVKPFFVQLRDLKTHKNLPGIESGDIGPTLGIEALEEGWCRFTHRTLPKFSLLARFGHIDDNGVSDNAEFIPQERVLFQWPKKMIVVSSLFRFVAKNGFSQNSTFAKIDDRSSHYHFLEHRKTTRFWRMYVSCSGLRE